MQKLTPEKLRKLREELKKQNLNNKSITVLVGMATCGIAAGARETFQRFKELIESKGVKNVIVKPTGCMGYCHVEPTIEILMSDMPNTLYGKVKSDLVDRIIEEHIIRKQLVNEIVFDKPAIDILK